MELNDFLLGTLFGIIVCMWLGYIVLGQLADILINANSQETLEVSELVIRARIEEVGGIFYVWNTDNNEFVVQGRSVKEMQDKLSNKQLQIKITDGDDAVIQRFKSTG
jgi:hypothetical protein